MMIEEKVKEMLNEKEWTFADLQNMSDIVSEFVEILYDEINASEKLKLVWDIDTTELFESNLGVYPFGLLFQQLVKDKLTEDVIEVVKIELMNANVNFNKEEDKNEVPKRSVGRKSSKKRTTNEETSSKE